MIKESSGLCASANHSKSPSFMESPSNYKSYSMIKFITATLLSALLSTVCCLFLPWWSIGVACFVVAAVVAQRPLYAFLAGFTGLFLLWGGLSWYLSSRNGHLLAHKMSVVILQSDRPALLILTTALIGGLVGGLAALAGSFVRTS